MRDKIFTMMLLMAVTASMVNGTATEQDKQEKAQSTQNQESSVGSQNV